MNPQEITRLAHATNELRPDWPISSLTTFITRNLSNRAYRDSAVALTWVATDVKLDGTPATSTPKRVLENGPWWAAAVIGGDANGGRPNPPKRGEQCTRCGGVPPCGCTREHLAATYDEQKDEIRDRMDRATALQAARAALVAAKGAEIEPTEEIA